MISYWTSVGRERNASEPVSKSSGSISSMNARSSSSVARRGSGMLWFAAFDTTAERLTSGSLNGS